MAEKNEIRKDNSNRIGNEIFKKKAEIAIKRIGNLSKHFMNIYLVDLLIIIQENKDINEKELVEEMIIRNKSSNIATIQFVNAAAESIRQWLILKANDSQEKNRIIEISKERNGAINILKMFAEYIENSRI